MKRVLILTEVFYPDTIGGAGKYTYQTARALRNGGFDVWVITRRPKDLSAQDSIDGIKVFRVDWSTTPHPLKPFLFFKGTSDIFNALSNEGDFNIVIFSQSFSAFSIIFSKKIKAVPKIYTFQSSWADEFEIKSFLKHQPHKLWVIIKKVFLAPVVVLMRFIERIAIRKCDRVIVLSQYTKDRLCYLYAIDPGRVTIIPAGVDTDKFKPLDNEKRNALRLKLGIKNESFILFTARNLVPRMGLDNLISALKILVKDEPRVELIIAGGGFLEKRLKSQAKKLQLLDKINFVGVLSEEDLVKYYQASDLFVLPTQFLEGFGISTVEALSSGLPVLGTPVGGTVEILTKFDKNFLFAGTDAFSIAEKILGFIRNSKDKNLLFKLCRQFILDNYSSDKFCNEMNKFCFPLSVINKSG